MGSAGPRHARSATSAFERLGSRDGGVVSDCLFFVPFGLWLAIKVLQKTFFFETYGIEFDFLAVRVALLAMLALREVLFGRWGKTSVAGLAVFGFLAIVSFNANWAHLVDGACLIFAARDIDFRKLAVFSLVELAVLVAFVFAACGLGFLPNYTYARNGSIPRNTLGFTWVNTASSFCLYLCCLWVFLRGNAHRVIDSVLVVALAAVLFALTNSQGAFVSTVALIVLFLALPALGKRLGGNRAFNAACIAVPVGIALLACFLAVAYNPEVGWMANLDKLCSSRISLAHNVLAEYGIPLFGQRKPFGGIAYYDEAGVLVAGDVANLVDCLYPKLLVHCGLVFFLVCIALLVAACKHAVDCGQWVLMAVIVACALHGLVEPFAGYLFFNPFLFLLGGLFAEGAAFRPLSAHVGPGRGKRPIHG